MSEDSNVPELINSTDQAGQANNATRRDDSQDQLGEAPEGQHKIGDESGSEHTEADVVAPDRTGPGTGDGVDTRPLGDPDAPQGTGPEVPGAATPAEDRPAPAGEVRTSWAAQGHTNS